MVCQLDVNLLLLSFILLNDRKSIRCRMELQKFGLLE